MRTLRTGLLLLACAGALVACGGGGGGSGSEQSFCAIAKEQLASRSFGNLDPNNAADAKKIVAVFDRLETAAPSAVKGDVQTLGDGIRKLIADRNLATKDTALLDDLQRSSTNVERYTEDHWDVSLSGS